MTHNVRINIASEIGALEGVILHPPGPEVENMTPESAQRALYSDVLNLAVLNDEFAEFERTLEQVTAVFHVQDLLSEVLEQDEARKQLITSICTQEQVPDIIPRLLPLSPHELARLLIEGVLMEKDNLTKYLDHERYALQPLHNFFFMRDAAAVIFDQVLISRMANQVREREALIMEAIFSHHPALRSTVFHPGKANPPNPLATIEGGDILVARDDILIVGQSARTSTQGIDGLIDHLKARNDLSHIIVQELPYKPESFIHLDMVFTLLDVDACMIYKPLVLDSNRYLTIHIRIDHGKVTLEEANDIPEVLDRLGMPVTAICCGSRTDVYTQEREQWHSGANFFCVGPGKAIGYGRNVFTLEALDRHGFEIVPAAALTDKAFDIQTRRKVAITIEGTELARGGGGCRCMTLPLRRKTVTWD